MLQFFISVALAQGNTGSQRIGELITNPLNAQTVQDLFDNIYRYAFVFGSIVAVAVTMWGAFQILTSGGDPKGYQKGLQTIKWVMIGYAILLLSGGITSLVKIILGGTLEEPAQNSGIRYSTDERTLAPLPGGRPVPR
jgi:hypothetical protein